MGFAGWSFSLKAKKKDMNNEQEKTSLWLPCPKCGARSKIKIYEDTVLLNFPLYCTKCKEETKLGVIKFKIVVSDPLLRIGYRVKVWGV